MNSINRPIIYSATLGVVTGEKTNARSKTLLTLALEGGRTIKVDARHVEFRDVERFSRPVSFAEATRRMLADRECQSDRLAYNRAARNMRRA